MPDIQFGILDWLSSRMVENAAKDIRMVPVLDPIHDRGTQSSSGCVSSPERTEDGAGGGVIPGLGEMLVSDLVDERFETDHIAQQLSFIPSVR